MVDNIQHKAELISLGLTVPNLVLAASVVILWARSLDKKPDTSHQWFILGVVFGFTGAFLDNLYWFIPWTASFLELDIKDELINSGVYFNIVFRQGLGIVAAYCHLRAAQIYHNKTSFLNKLLATSTIIGVMYSVVILVYKESF